MQMREKKQVGEITTSVNFIINSNSYRKTRKDEVLINNFKKSTLGPSLYFKINFLLIHGARQN